MKKQTSSYSAYRQELAHATFQARSRARLIKPIEKIEVRTPASAKPVSWMDAVQDPSSPVPLDDDLDVDEDSLLARLRARSRAAVIE